MLNVGFRLIESISFQKIISELEITSHLYSTQKTLIFHKNKRLRKKVLFLQIINIQLFQNILTNCYEEIYWFANAVGGFAVLQNRNG